MTGEVLGHIYDYGLKIGEVLVHIDNYNLTNIFLIQIKTKKVFLMTHLTDGPSVKGG